MGEYKWTLEKINMAINETRENGLIYFNMHPSCNNTQDELENLNEYLFKKRPDLVFRFATENNNDLTFLSSMKNIKKLSLFNYELSNEIENMSQLVFLEICNVNKNALDIGFLEELNNLCELRLAAKIKNLEMIGKCKNLEKLYLSTNMDNYNFIRPLNKIKAIFIDHCTASNNFTLLNKPTLEELSITSISKLEDIETIKDFTTIKKLKLLAPKIKKLPEMNKLINLRELNLELMKVWENPEIIKIIPALEKIKLDEINTKLEAERFYFLVEMETLKEIDFRFIDFNKKRKDKIRKWFIKNCKENIIIK